MLEARLEVTYLSNIICRRTRRLTPFPPCFPPSPRHPTPRQTKVQKYSSLAQKINANFLCDEENPLIESKEEQELATDIDQDLNAVRRRCWRRPIRSFMARAPHFRISLLFCCCLQLAECINQMRSTSNSGAMSSPGGHHQEVLIKRYHEIHFDYSTEFRNTSSTVNRKRESMELFQSSKNLHGEEMDSSMAKILRERSTIAASMKSINDVISQAFEARSSLLGQRASIASASSGLGGLTANVPSFARLIDGIQKKKGRESMIVSVVIGILLCITIWWVFLR